MRRTKIYPHNPRGERRFGLLPTVMRCSASFIALNSCFVAVFREHKIVERIECHPDAARLDLKIALVCLRRFDHALTRAPKAGGAAPDTELTPEALANMRDESLLRPSTSCKRAATSQS